MIIPSSPRSARRRGSSVYPIICGFGARGRSLADISGARRSACGQYIGRGGAIREDSGSARCHIADVGISRRSADDGVVPAATLRFGDCSWGGEEDVPAAEIT